MQLELIAKVLALLAVANGAPVIAKKLLGNLFAYPFDAGRTFLDGRPLFGPSKTIRGILISLLATSVCAPTLGVPATVGLLIAFAAMSGDLISSFIKRRLGYASSSRASGLDQIPESLLPVLLCHRLLGLSVVDGACTVALFALGDVVISRLLFKLNIRDQPY
jgi:hypothetical protein